MMPKPENSLRRDSHYEYNTYELMTALWHRWYLIAGSIIASTAFAVGVLFLSNPVYESRAVVRIGITGVNDYIEAPGDVVARLRLTYHVDDPAHQANEQAWVDSVANSPESFVSIVTRSRQPALAQALAMEISTHLLERHKKIQERFISARKDQLNSLETLRDSIEQRKATLRRSETQSGDTMLAVAQALESAALESRLSDIYNFVAEFKQELLKVDQNGSNLVLAPVSPLSPKTPVKSLVLAIGFLLGCVIGAALVLIQEILARQRGLAGKSEARA